MDIRIRALEPHEWELVGRSIASAFGQELNREELESERPVFEASRTLAAFDGEDLVGSASAAPLEITVPGGEAPAAGVVGIATLPTHRRRGVMRALLRRQTDEFHEQGQFLAYLWASEGAIYQRFGYGTGALAAAFDIERSRTAFLRPGEERGRFHLLEREAALKAFPLVHDQVRQTRPGMPARDDMWWNAIFRDLEAERHGASPYFYVVHESDEGIDGYAVYRVKEGWSHQGPDFELDVEELMATTGEAYASMWRYCFEVDLVRRIRGWKRPADEPLLHMLAEPRSLRFQVRDGTWLRLIDVPRSLEARRYGVKGSVTFEVRDEFCPWNEGRHALEGGPDGAACRASKDEPDLVLDVADLAAAYLGGVRLGTLARAGRVEVRTPDALKQTDAMFASDVAPWCPHIF